MRALDYSAILELAKTYFQISTLLCKSVLTIPLLKAKQPNLLFFTLTFAFFSSLLPLSLRKATDMSFVVSIFINLPVRGIIPSFINNSNLAFSVCNSLSWQSVRWNYYLVFTFSILSIPFSHSYFSCFLTDQYTWP